MEENRTAEENITIDKLKKIRRIICILLAAGLIAVLLAVGAYYLADLYGYEFRAEVMGFGWVATLIYCAGIAGCVIWFLETAFPYPRQHIWGKVLQRIGCVLGITATLGALFCCLVLWYLGFAFGLREERIAVVDDITYVARMETSGWECSAISYHKRVNFALCEKEAEWVEDYDYEVWGSYE